jgi:RNA polymerase sigma-32 factor
VPLSEALLMMGRMTGPDMSLNTPQGDDGEGREWIELLEDGALPTEDAVLGRIEARRRLGILNDALEALPPRERRIVVQRHLHDTPATLTELGQELGISKERVRQLEERALARMRDSVSRAEPAG